MRSTIHFVRHFARTTLLLATLLLFSDSLRAGGVLFVAGISAFDPNVAGKPINWANGSVLYFTDQGDLSPVLPQTSANAFIADAFLRWTQVPTAGVQAIRGGGLAEDVNGNNVYIAGGELFLPVDIQPTASNRPLGIVFDQDGQVLESLLGTGASDAALCNTNSVIGDADHFSTDAHITHALIVINGLCVQSSSDLAPLKYRLVRVLGRVLGLGWSQLNDNVVVGTPTPSVDDYSGFPLMHPLDPGCGQAIPTCLPNPDQLRMDDRAALSYLYPITAQNIGSFPGKQLTNASTVRIRGTLYFADAHGQPGQPMQGVNVVARLIDPNSGLPSSTIASSSVSGFLFSGNIGNPVSGFVAPTGDRFDRFGGDQTSLRGYYEIGGLELPANNPSATYQITLEPVNPLYKAQNAVGAYRSGTVSPSGTVAPFVLSGLTAGMIVTRDIILSSPAGMMSDSAEPSSFVAPAPVPSGGTWWSSLNGYGDSDFFSFHGRAGRTFHFHVTALDEKNISTTAKAQPMLGIWPSNAPSGALPYVNADAFNTAVAGQTRLSGVVNADGDFKLGIADFRGDGRPDFRYQAHLLYADAVTPDRIANGGTMHLLLRGTGFDANTSVKIGGAAAPVLYRSSTEMVVTAPNLNNIVGHAEVTDQATGTTATITNGVRFGVVVDDQLLLISSANPSIPLGAEIQNPIRVRVVTANGTTPVPNAAVTFSVSPAQSLFTACGSTQCTLTTDSSGEVAAIMLVRSAGANTVTAAIANGAHLLITIVGTSTSPNLFSSLQNQQVLSGSSMAVPLKVRALSQGLPMVGQTINFNIVSPPSSGSASLNGTIFLTDSAGDATAILNISNLGGATTIGACLGAGPPCTNLTVQPVPISALQLQWITGSSQILVTGQPAQPLLLRTVDSVQGKPVTGVTVAIYTSVFQRPRNDCTSATGVCQAVSVRPIAGFTSNVVTDARGLVSHTPAIQASWGAVNIAVLATVGTSSAQTQLANLLVLRTSP